VAPEARPDNHSRSGEMTGRRRARPDRTTAPRPTRLAHRPRKLGHHPRPTARPRPQATTPPQRPEVLLYSDLLLDLRLRHGVRSRPRTLRTMTWSWIYALTRSATGLMVLRPPSETAKDAELPVLRHEVTVPRRPVTRPGRGHLLAQRRHPCDVHPHGCLNRLGRQPRSWTVRLAGVQRHAARWYSWMSPPRTSTRSTRLSGPDRSGATSAGGIGTSRSLPRCGPPVL
jgi:hypothetical protein